MDEIPLIFQDPVLTLVLKKHRPKSWNQLFGRKHWSIRNHYVNEAKQLIRGLIDPEVAKPFETRVDIEVVTYFKNRPLDSDNVIVKPYLDGFIGWYLVDDTLEFVRYVLVKSDVDARNPRMEFKFYEVRVDG